MTVAVITAPMPAGMKIVRVSISSTVGFITFGQFGRNSSGSREGMTTVADPGSPGRRPGARWYPC